MRAIALGAAWFAIFVALGRYAPGFMDEPIYRSFTIGHALAVSQFAMIALVGWAELRNGDPEWERSAAAPPASPRR